jgi:hypothetical protein
VYRHKSTHRRLWRRHTGQVHQSYLGQAALGYCTVPLCLSVGCRQKETLTIMGKGRTKTLLKCRCVSYSSATIPNLRVEERIHSSLRYTVICSVVHASASLPRRRLYVQYRYRYLQRWLNTSLGGSERANVVFNECGRISCRKLFVV